MFPVLVYASLFAQGLLRPDLIPPLLLQVQAVLMVGAYALFGYFLFQGTWDSCFRRVVDPSMAVKAQPLEKRPLVASREFD
jgi:Na+-transporting NADH:ubiquinone oxidoreductase subunit NqrB